jgi:mannose-6-phosphate isomerase-like protein (cupin superfamily)
MLKGALTMGVATRLVAGAVVIVCIGSVALAKPASTRVISEAAAKAETSGWGTFHVYCTGETRGSRDGFAGVADIKPGQEVHPAHRHAEEEYLLITEGSGTWTVGDRVFPAKTGDMLYAAPWDLHGIRNTGSVNLKFVVWKWNAKAIPTPLKPRAKR